MATDITTDTSNLVINGETYNVKKGATVDGTVMSKGKLQLYNSTGGKVKNFIVSGGTMLVRSSVNSADTITLFGGIFNLQKGGSAVNIDLVNGTLDADTVGYGGGYVSTLRISGGTATFKGTVASDVTQSDGKLNVDSGAAVSALILRGGTARIYESGLISGGQVSGGSLYVSDGGVAEALAFAGGTATVSEGGLLSGAAVNGGKVFISNGGSASAVTQAGGSVTVYDGGLLSGGAVNGGIVTINDGATVTGITLTGGTLKISAAAIVNNITWNSGSISIANGATLNNVTKNGTELCPIKDGTVFNNLTLNKGTTSIVRGAKVKGGSFNNTDDITVTSGGFVEDVTITQGTVNVKDGSWTGGAITGGTLSIWNGATLDGITISGGTVNISATAIADNLTWNGGTLSIAAGATLNNVTKNAAATWGIVDGITINNLTLNNGIASIVRGAKVKGGTFNTADRVILNSGGFVEDVDIVRGEVRVQSGTWTGGAISGGKLLASYDNAGSLIDGLTISNGEVTILSAMNSGSDLSLRGGNLTISGGAVVESAAVTGGTMIVNEGGNASELGQNGGRVIIRGANGVASGVTVRGGNMSVGNGGALNDATISGGAVVVRHVAGWVYDDIKSATASNVRIESGAGLTLESGGILQAGELANGANLTIYKGGKAAFASAAAGAEINISFWDVNAGHGNTNAIITDWGDFSANANVKVHSIETGYSYKIAEAANANVTLDCGSYRTIFDDAVKSGEQYSNAFLGRNLDFSDGTTLVVSSFTVDLATTAAKFSAATATSLADGGFAAKWNGDTAYAGGNLTIADANLNGNVWLTLNGFDQSAANIYGAEGAFDHDVNMWLYDGTVKNLAAGAKLGGSVDNVNILISDTNKNGMKVAGALYAGGMGDVTGEIKTIVYGGEFAGNVFAGALCNYVANNTATDTGDISLTVNGGTFKSNIYAGAAVKAGSASTVVHTADDITLTLTGGIATKGAFCVYGGGYATGTTEDALVYTAGEVDIAVTGGEWGTYLSGRGIFGGVYADKVAASVEDVEISVTGGTMGNIYGGGWAQNGGTSTVADGVSITIAGTAEVSNVFGGGSYSSVSGGTTSVVGGVTITVAGGSIEGNIFAAGQGQYSTVAGDVSVTFTGSNDYTCNVYGYGVQSSATAGGDKTLAFVGYTGELSGDIGGFDSIVISGDTAATLSGATIDNSDWSFDYTDRTLDAATAMLTLDGWTFANDNVAVDLTGVEQVAGGWSIAAGLTAANATYSVELSTGSASGLALGNTLDSSYGIYEGWGFTLEESTLKFKNLA